MKTQIKIIVFVLLYMGFPIQAQNQEVSQEKKNFVNKINKESNLYKTDNTKEILTTFLRTALNNITNKEKSFSLNTTLYAIDSLLHLSDKEPSNFVKQTSFDFKLKANENNDIAVIYFGFTTPIVNNKNLKLKTLTDEESKMLSKNVLIQADLKRALHTQRKENERINNRRIYLTDSLVAAVLNSLQNNEVINNLTNAQGEVKTCLSKLYADLNLSSRETDSLNTKMDGILQNLFKGKTTTAESEIKNSLTLLKEYLSNKENNLLIKRWDDAKKRDDFTGFKNDFNKINFERDFITEVTKDDNYYQIIENYKTGKDPLKAYYRATGEKYSRKMLWTISPAMEYDRENKQGNYTVTSKMTVGISNKKQRKPWEIEANASFKVSKDTLQQMTNHNNQVGLINLGVNKVLLENENSEPKMEFKFFTQLEHQFGKNYDTPKSIFSLNSTLRINLFKTIWLPITVKYDPDNGNLFGFFSIAANLSD